MASNCRRRSVSAPGHILTSTIVWSGVKEWAMQHHTKEGRDPPKLEGDEEAYMTASAEALDSPTSETMGAQAEQTQAALTPNPRSGCGLFCHPWCLLLTLTLLLLSLLGSWAVVHLTLATHRGSPFRVSASYDQRIPQDDTATIEPHFTTNCTMGEFAPSKHVFLCMLGCVSSVGWDLCIR